jgi:hypothetical protein
MKYAVLFLLLVLSNNVFSATKSCEKLAVNRVNKFSETYRLYFRQDFMTSPEMMKRRYIDSLPYDFSTYHQTIAWEFTNEGRNWVDLKISANKKSDISNLVDTLRDGFYTFDHLSRVEHLK